VSCRHASRARGFAQAKTHLVVAFRAGRRGRRRLVVRVAAAAAAGGSDPDATALLQRRASAPKKRNRACARRKRGAAAQLNASVRCAPSSEATTGEKRSGANTKATLRPRFNRRGARNKRN
jgi:hypothetical protein